MSEKFQAVVIGGGPGGYVCAIRLAQLGIKTACIESRGSLGGTCLNVGCIPSKNLLNISENYHKAQNFSKLGIEVGEVKLNLEKMMKNKDKAVTILTKGVEFLFKKNKVTYLKGKGVLFSKNDVVVYNNNKKENYKAKNIVIATGSDVASLPGITIDEKNIISSTGALSLNKVPKKFIHKPWEMELKYQQAINTLIGKDYPKPIVIHEDARASALEAFQSLKKK